jgi:hypothetical protein
VKRRAVLAALPALIFSAQFALAGELSEGEQAIFAALAEWARDTKLALLAPGARVQAVATHPLLLGRPYLRGPLEGAEEVLRAGFDGYDCVTFVETVLALVAALAQPEPAFDDYCARLAAIRYRDGQRGYCTRLHYFSDWARANVVAGRLREATTTLADHGAAISTTTAAVGYRALGRHLAASTAAYAVERRACIAAMEQRLAVELPTQCYLPLTDTRRAVPALEAGDLLAWVAKRGVLDVTHLSLVTVSGTRRGLVHASQRAGRVTTEASLASYAASLRDVSGIRVFRLAAG